MDPKERKPLDDSLERLEEALARTRETEVLAAPKSPATLAPVPTSVTVATPAVATVLGALTVFLLWKASTSGGSYLVTAAFPALLLAALLLWRKVSAPPRLLLSGGGPHVGMGATVASDVVMMDGSVVDMGATVEAGAVLKEGSLVEMGATVGAGAVLERGAVVRMGATVGARAVLEEGASVSWGVSVGEGAVVGAGAVVAAGSDISPGARVPPHTYLSAGTTWTAGVGDAKPLPAAPTAEELEAAADPRAEQINKACDRLEEEYRRAPEPVRAMFGDAQTTLTSLRRTCLDLVARERTLRAEASPEALARLDQEKAAIEARQAQASDDQVRSSLAGAVKAIVAQKEQRMQLQNSADRLEAELTRLIWTVDGMGTELVRVRTAGAELYKGSTAEIARSVEQLKDEIDNVAQALEEVTR